MLYQKLLMGREPYYVSLTDVSMFETHRHHEIEISFCLEGEYDIVCENSQYTLKKGDIAIIPSMASHSIPKQKESVRKSLVVELGYIFLGVHFEFFFEQGSNCILIRKDEYSTNNIYDDLVRSFKEIAYYKQEYSPVSELLIKGNLYRISALLFELFQQRNIVNIPTTRRNEVAKIDIALETIYNRYYESLSVEEVSALCGYNKSNFCKIFKAVTGNTFHEMLNRHRIEIACTLLRETNYSVEEIAQNTGFADSKSFCRVFRKIMNKNAGEYRKTLK